MSITGVGTTSNSNPTSVAAAETPRRPEVNGTVATATSSPNQQNVASPSTGSTNISNAVGSSNNASSTGAIDMTGGDDTEDPISSSNADDVSADKKEKNKREWDLVKLQKIQG